MTVDYKEAIERDWWRKHTPSSPWQVAGALRGLGDTVRLLESGTHTPEYWFTWAATELERFVEWLPSDLFFAYQNYVERERKRMSESERKAVARSAFMKQELPVLREFFSLFPEDQRVGVATYEWVEVVFTPYMKRKRTHPLNDPGSYAFRSCPLGYLAYLGNCDTKYLLPTTGREAWNTFIGTNPDAINSALKENTETKTVQSLTMFIEAWDSGVINESDLPVIFSVEPEKETVVGKD